MRQLFLKRPPPLKVAPCSNGNVRWLSETTATADVTILKAGWWDIRRMSRNRLSPRPRGVVTKRELPLLETPRLLGACRIWSTDAVDRLTLEQRSANMRAIRSTGMKPELTIRRLTHGMGYRYRLHCHRLPGRPDMTFARRKKVIFVHGCFWHQHSDPDCKLTHRPVSKLAYWEPKLRRNQERDRQHHDKLSAAGWHVLTLWECEIRQTPPQELASRLRYFLDDEIDDPTRNLSLAHPAALPC